jgi:hypothetical protein
MQWGKTEKENQELVDKLGERLSPSGGWCNAYGEMRVAICVEDAEQLADELEMLRKFYNRYKDDPRLFPDRLYIGGL